MKRWHVVIIVLLLAACGWLVVTHPPGTRDIGQMPVAVLPSVSPTSSPKSATLLFAGDIMLSRSVGDFMAAHNDWVWPFADIASVTRSADIAFANLETTVSTRGTKNGCGFCFRSDPRAMSGLVFAGFDVLSVANNHTWDYGPQAFADTLQYLATDDISAVGGGRTVAEARAPVILTAGDARVAFLAYTNLLPASAAATATGPGVNLYDPVRMNEDIAHARTLADIVVVSFHGGTEYMTTHTTEQEQIYQTAIDDGADLVVGTHPHVVEELQKYDRGWIAYSLGNFVFDQTFSDATEHGALLRVTVQGKHITDAHLEPVVISKQYQVSVPK